MSRTLISLLVLSCAAAGCADAGRLAVMHAKGGVLVLAKTIGIEDGPAGVESPGGDPTQSTPREWKYLVLERIDAFMGTTPRRFKVAISPTEVSIADYFAHPPKSGGYSGPGPMGGFEPGDVAVWPLQSPDETGTYDDYGWFLQVPEEHRIDPSPLPSFTAPGSNFALVNGRQGQFLVAGGAGMIRSSKQMPEYDRSLPPGLRYADLLAAMVIRDLPSKTLMTTRSEEFSLLAQLQGDLLGSDVIPAWVTPGEFAGWEKSRLLKRWTKDDVAQLNLLAVQLHWQETSLEPRFLAMLKGQKRSSLYAPIPTITDENYYVECCEGSDPYIACEGFSHVRYSKNVNPRVLKAAMKWIAEITSPGPDQQRTDTIKACGLPGDILWYMSAVTGIQSLTENWDHPTTAAMLAANQAADNLLHKR